jgi:uncharacterized membrane protein YdjX (TVP38/TMEM64 family)
MADKLRGNKKLVIAVLVGVICLTAYLIYVFFGDFFAQLYDLLKTGDQEKMAEYLNSRSQWGGYAALFFCSILQVVSVFMPGMVIQITGALIYGWWRAFIICWLGFTAGNALVFLCARIFGKSIEFALDTEKKSSWIMNKINQGNPVLVIAVACMIPGIPNGIIPYIAARSRITLKDFVGAVFASSSIQILLNCVTGHFLVRGEWAWMVAAIAVQALMIFLVIKYRDKLLNTKN